MAGRFPGAGAREGPRDPEPAGRRRRAPDARGPRARSARLAGLRRLCSRARQAMRRSSPARPSPTGPMWCSPSAATAPSTKWRAACSARRVSLGIVPVGSGNGLARALGIPLQPAAALAALETATRRAIDVGFLNGRPFLNVAGAGFDAAVGHAFHERGKQGGRRGLFGYVHLSLRELRAYRAPRVVLEVEGGVRHELYPFVLTFANGPQYGSGAVVNPGARLDDGVLEIVLFEDGSRLATLAAATRLFLGGVERLARYRRFTAARATVTATAPLPLHVDGDPIAPVERRRGRAAAPRALGPRAAGRGGRESVPRTSVGGRRPSDQEQAASARSTSDRISSRAEGGAGSSGERT